jgi:hypothetical protein
MEYKIVIGSPVDYEKLVAYIIINNREIALINQDAGNDQLKIDFLEGCNGNTVDYDTFVEALMEAKKSLIE